MVRTHRNAIHVLKHAPLSFSARRQPSTTVSHCYSLRHNWRMLSWGEPSTRMNPVKRVVHHWEVHIERKHNGFVQIPPPFATSLLAHRFNHATSATQHWCNVDTMNTWPLTPATSPEHRASAGDGNIAEYCGRVPTYFSLSTKRDTLLLPDPQQLVKYEPQVNKMAQILERGLWREVATHATILNPDVECYYSI